MRKSQRPAGHLLDVPEGLEVVSVGSGPGLYGVRFDGCGRRGYSLCTAPQSLAYGFRILKHFSDRLASGAAVIIVVCPLSFGDNASARTVDYSDRFYGVLSPGEIDGYSVRRARLLRRYRWIQLGRAKRLLPPAPLPDDPPLIAGWKKQFGLSDLKNPGQAQAHREAFAQKARTLSEEISFCKEKGLRPVIVLPPVPPQTRAYFSDEFLDAFLYAPLAEVLKAHSDVPALDYFADLRFGDALFRQGIFLKPDGAERFSKILFGDMKL